MQNRRRLVLRDGRQCGCEKDEQDNIKLFPHESLCDPGTGLVSHFHACLGRRQFTDPRKERAAGFFSDSDFSKRDAQLLRSGFERVTAHRDQESTDPH